MLKMHQNEKRKEEREGAAYLRRVLRSTRKRKRRERWSDERERRRERGLVGLKEP